MGREVPQVRLDPANLSELASASCPRRHSAKNPAGKRMPLFGRRHVGGSICLSMERKMAAKTLAHHPILAHYA